MSQVSKKTSSGDLPTLVQTVTTQDGIATAAANNMNFNGYPQVLGNPQIGITHASGSTFTYEDRAWLTAFVVDPSTTVGTRGTYSTIASALTDATAGTTIFIRAGTYTENLTLKAGVNLQGFDASQEGQATVINGTCTASFSGTCNLSGLTLRTNSAPFLTTSGANTTIVNIYDSYLDMTNNTGISHTSSGAGSQINIRNCNGNIGTTGITPFVSTSAGGIQFDYTEINNTGGSTTPSTTSTQIVSMSNCQFNFPISATGTGSFYSFYSQISTSAVAVTTSGTGISSFNVCYLSGLTSSAISIGAGTTVNLNNTTVNSSNTNAIAGSGTLTASEIIFDGNSSRIQSTLTFIKKYASSFQYISTQTFTSNGTYTPSPGMKYCLVEVWGGGGGGAGCPVSGATTVSSGGGGGGGGYGKGIFTANQIGASQAVTIGTGGAGGVGNAAGGAGNTSSLGALISAGGGSGGANAGAGSIVAVSGGPGGSGGSGGYYHIDGGDGGAAFSVYNAAGSGTSGGQGGSSGAGGGGGAQSAGGSATSNNGSAGAKGGGGSGACNTESQPARNGGAGGDGYMAITEFC